VGVNTKIIPLPFIPSRQGRGDFRDIIKVLEENSQIERCKNPCFFRDLARKKWPASGGQRKNLKSFLTPLWQRGKGGIYRQTFLSYKHVCINEALSAYCYRKSLPVVVKDNLPCFTPFVPISRSLIFLISSPLPFTARTSRQLCSSRWICKVEMMVW